MIATGHQVAQNTSGIWFAIGGLALASILGAMAISAVRSHFRKEQAHSEAFTLQQLREMRRAGDIDDDQFEQLKARLLHMHQSPVVDTDDADTPQGPEKTDE